MSSSTAAVNVGANFALGGCDWPDTWPKEKWMQVKEIAVKSPAKTVYLTDGGTQALNSKDPLKCVTDSTPEKPGSICAPAFRTKA